VVSATNQLKLLAPDGKHRLTDVLDYAGVMLLAENIPNSNAARFVHWFASDNDRETFMKGIDYSYYYEQEDNKY
jgi:cell filamentation protein